MGRLAVPPGFLQAMQQKVATDAVVLLVIEALKRKTRPCLCVSTCAENALLKPLKLYRLYRHLPIDVRDLHACTVLDLKFVKSLPCQ